MPSHPHPRPVLHSSLRTPLHLKPLTMFSSAAKPGLSHTQDGSQAPTGGNSCATTPVKPASRLRVSPLAQRESARPRESAVSKWAGGASAPPRCRRLARGCRRRGRSARCKHRAADREVSDSSPSGSRVVGLDVTGGAVLPPAAVRASKW